MAVALMLMITIATAIRVLLFIVRRHAKRSSVTMVKYNKLEGVDIDDD